MMTFSSSQTGSPTIRQLPIRQAEKTLKVRQQGCRRHLPAARVLSIHRRMSKHKQNRRRSSGPSSGRSSLSNPIKVWLGLATLVALAGAVSFWRGHNMSSSEQLANRPASVSTSASNSLPVAEIAQSLMVTAELDFGTNPPSMRQALKEIERHSQADAGAERTFAVLDADGGPTPDGKLHIQMHLSMERPGLGSLVFHRTGEVLWKSKIVAPTNGPPKQKQLTIYMANAAGQSYLLDGSKGLKSVLDLPINNTPGTVRDWWPDGAEHEFTFLYSMCGCPVKAKVRRTGETTARTTELPVMFPDDPEAMRVISQIMGWPATP